MDIFVQGPDLDLSDPGHAFVLLLLGVELDVLPQGNLDSVLQETGIVTFNESLRFF